MGKYKIIHRNDKLPWQESCPIEILAIQVSRDTLTGICYLQTKMANISNQAVESVEINIDLHHNTDQESVELKLLDADIPAGAISTPMAIKIELDEVSESSASVIRVDKQLSFGKVVTSNGSKPVELEQALSEERSTLILEAGGDETLCKGRLEEHAEWWQCGCGAINLGRQACWRCKCPLDTQSKTLSAEFLEESKSNRLYQEAVSLMRSKQKDDNVNARDIFETLAKKNYKDSTMQVVKSDERLAKLKIAEKRKRKMAAFAVGAVALVLIVTLFINKNVIVSTIQNYFEATQISDQIQKASVGDTIAFGTPTTYMGNGQKSIEWIVLTKENGKALVISKDCVDYREFGAHSSEPDSADYESSELFAYLNGSFKTESFDDAQRSIMASDVLVLDVDTIEQYMPTDSSRIAISSIKNSSNPEKGEPWWTSTNSTDDYDYYWGLDHYDCPAFAYVSVDGSIDYEGLEDDGWDALGVRPAIWINL